MKKYSYYLQIADLSIKINMPFKIKVKEESINFISNKTSYDIMLDFSEVEKPISISGKILFEGQRRIYKTDKGLVHEFYKSLNSDSYAWRIPIGNYNYEIRYLKGKEKYFKYSQDIINAMSLEYILNINNAFMLHSSFIKHKNKAILFSAPSGTGKSTQADLWDKYENAEIINGDRAGIRKIGDEWTAYGLPFAGSSHIFKNKKAPISHIIILRQGKENKLKRLSPREAFIKIYSETTIHTWDKEFQNNIVNMITDLVQNIPVYQYECLPDKSAVEFLKQKIEEDNNGGILNEAEISRA